MTSEHRDVHRHDAGDRAGHVRLRRRAPPRDHPSSPDRRRRGAGAGARGRPRSRHVAPDGRPPVRDPARVRAAEAEEPGARARPRRHGRGDRVGRHRVRRGRRGVRRRRGLLRRVRRGPCGQARAASRPSLSFEQAAVVPISALTALQALRDAGRLAAGQKVLVIGASGGVGSYAVQMAKAFGAEVTGVCQHRQARPGPIARRRPRHRLHARRLRRRRAPLRPDPRHRRQPDASLDSDEH